MAVAQQNPAASTALQPRWLYASGLIDIKGGPVAVLAGWLVYLLFSWKSIRSFAQEVANV